MELRFLIIPLLIFAGTVEPIFAAETVEPEQSASDYPLAVEAPALPPAEPVEQQEIVASIKRGVEFLLETQLENGSWGRSANSKYYRIWAPVPGSHHAFRTAVTSLALQSLVESRELFDGELRDRVETSLDRGQEWLIDNALELRRSEPDEADDYFGYAIYSVWGHAYAIHGAKSLHQRAEGDAALQEKLEEVIEYQVDRLKRISFVNGGWGYYDGPFTDQYGRPVKPRRARLRRPTDSSMSFATATVLIALKEAESLGHQLPEDYIEAAKASLLRQRFPDFAYAYGEYLRLRPRMDINRPAGSLGRSQVCNLAMQLYDDPQVTDEVFKAWLNRLIVRNGWLSMSRKRHIPGESPHFADFGVAGYFYYYGHFYASMCIEQLPEDERLPYQQHLANILMPLQEKDGSWWDYILYDYHQQYGTAMTISALVRCLPATPADGK